MFSRSVVSEVYAEKRVRCWPIEKGWVGTVRSAAIILRYAGYPGNQKKNTLLCWLDEQRIKDGIKRADATKDDRYLFGARSGMRDGPRGSRPEA